MGETQDTLFEPDFNRSIKVQAFSQKITSHAGAVLLREADHQLGLMELLADQIQDPRNPEKIRYTTVELLRERIYAMAMGSENQDDLNRLAHDPVMRMATWDRPGETPARTSSHRARDQAIHAAGHWAGTSDDSQF